MSTRLWFSLLLFVACVGCTKTTAVDHDGGDSAGSGGGGTKASGGSGGGGRGGSSAGKGGSGGSASKDDAGAAMEGMDGSAPAMDVDGGIPCGAKICQPNACCADPFAALCGAPIGERACLIPTPPSVMSDKRCPSINVMNLFTIPSCCTDDGQCGIDATNFGSGCVELGVAAEMAQQMGGTFIDWPKPRACE